MVIGDRHRASCHPQLRGLFDEVELRRCRDRRRAGEFLNIVCANNVVRGVGRAVYTQALNTRGGIECDFTVTQTGEHSFFIVTGTAFGTHDLGWLKKQRRELDYPEVQLDDVTGAYACFGLWGPKAPEILSGITPTDVSNEAFRFLHSREITVGDIPVRATRITYVGELGWEMYVSTEYGAALWQVLLDAGTPHQLMACGYKAIDSLRLEKGYRAWGGEINSETSPWEAGLGFAVALGKEKFIGRDALVASKGNETMKLAGLHFDDIRRVPLGNEPIRIGDEIVGRVKSGGQGFTLGKSIGYGYLPIEHSARTGSKSNSSVSGEWGVSELRQVFRSAERTHRRRAIPSVA